LSNKDPWPTHFRFTNTPVPVTSEELAMACTGNATSSPYTRNGETFNAPWGWARNVLKNPLPFPMRMESVFWMHMNCGGHFISGQYEGQEVAYQEFFIPKQGRHCSNDWQIHIMNFGGSVVDEVWADETSPNGGLAKGRYYIPGDRAIRTSQGVVVLEQLRDRRDRNGNLLPSDRYNLEYSSGQGYLIWFGNSRTTAVSEGSQSTTNNATYVLGCVDIDNNNQCDFQQGL
jgi:hypothetical protein